MILVYSYIFKMSQQTIGIGIAFAAMGLVTVAAEPVIEGLGFLSGLFDKSKAEGGKRIQLPRRNFEIGNNRAAGVFGRHGRDAFRDAADASRNPPH